MRRQARVFLGSLSILALLSSSVPARAANAAERGPGSDATRLPRAAATDPGPAVSSPSIDERIAAFEQARIDAQATPTPAAAPHRSHKKAWIIAGVIVGAAIVVAAASGGGGGGGGGGY